ncbi:PP2C family protein-serine/threonine phosphatase [Oceanobacillus profundus]|uniref:Serine/threonine-protein phosphatase n=1 Tax=Oceanobacillus profundus TaxID=372463 RepID=A0A417YJC1_9BACI|nr:protein phosphatase 2C domain-containing protein [Oceanobacillus profundus]MBR3118341.1 serine/threonine-protein phosphatase [Oceanobacillus sp.]RHW33101.1 serine/threonine-protein phosphatase [Oceanobacillus profundus]
MSRNWQTGVATHQGMKKSKNEDSYLHLMEKDTNGNEIALFVVADGMGGYQIGDIASRFAIAELEKWWNKRISKLIRRKDTIERVLKETEHTLQQINKGIKALSQQTGKKMGTTLSMIVMYQGSYAVIHIGDSRIYHMKNWNYGLQQYFQQEAVNEQYLSSLLEEQHTEILETEPELLKLTEDHSWVQAQVTNGILSEEEARSHPKRHVLTQCLGIESTINVYSHKGTYQASDLFLVCSDGFYSLFSNEEIKNMLVSLEKEYTNLQAICDYLINFSNFSDANDNITLMLIRNLYVNTDYAAEKKGFFSFLKGTKL